MKTGRFCWAELHTRHPDAATAFYDALLTDGGSDPLDVDALVKRPFDVYRHDAFGPVTPGWKLYVAVDNAFATTERAETCGGERREPRRDLDGRIVSTIADPLGNVLGIWENRGYSGFDPATHDNLYSKPYLYTTNVESALRFYQGVLGWSARPMSRGGQPVTAMLKGNDVVAYVASPPNGITPSAGWVPSWKVADIQVASACATELGSTFMSTSEAATTGNAWAVGVDLDSATFRMVEAAPADRGATAQATGLDALIPQ